MKKTNVFLTSDFSNDDHEMGSIEKYDYTISYDDFITHCRDYQEWDKTTNDRVKKIDKLSEGEDKEEFIREIKSFIEDYPDTYDDWFSEADEPYEVPMMNCLRYFPSFCDFSEADRYKTSGATTLLYDNERETWAVGMTGGGMDLTPNLLETFIKLGNGIPKEVADGVRLTYNAYIPKERHEENCRLLADAYAEQGQRDLYRYIELRGEDKDESPITRHIKGIDKETQKSNA